MTERTPASFSGLRPFLDRAEVLAATVAQLQKDLAISPEELPCPAVGEDAFEQLRSKVLPVLESCYADSPHRFQVAMYRVDIPEVHFNRVMAAGGLHALAGEVVLRCLQKVRTRARFAGRG